MTFSKKLFDSAGSSTLLTLRSGSVHPNMVYLVHAHSQTELHKTFSSVAHVLFAQFDKTKSGEKKVAIACPGRSERDRSES